MFCTITVSAYIDPATTAMLTQIIAGIFITLGVVFAVFRRKIVLFFKNIRVNMTKNKIERQSKKAQGSTKESPVSVEKPQENNDVDSK
jgi:hypothetical protein